MKLAFAFVLALCVVSICPTTGITRFFSSSFEELRLTLYRYTYCYGDIPAYKTDKLNEDDYLVNQVKQFLEQGNYSSDQLANVSILMDNICLSEPLYPISINMNLSKYDNTTGKEHRCNAIDQALNSLYQVFRRAAWNQSEPLDFSSIHYYPNTANRSKFYNLTDLINTSWIKALVPLEHVCTLTESIKNYVTEESTRFVSKDFLDRAGSSNDGGFIRCILDHLYGCLDLFNGYKRRMTLDASNRFEQVTFGFCKYFSSVGDVISSRGSTLIGLVSSNASSNATSVKKVANEPKSV